MKKIVFIFSLLCCAGILAAQDLHIVFIGNSITQGAQLADVNTQSPPARAAAYVAEQLRGTVDFRNCGFSGRTTVNFLPVTNTEFPRVLAAADELSTDKGLLLFSIMLGTNDSAEQGPLGAPVHPSVYYTNLQAIVDALLEKYPRALVVLHRPIWYSPNTYNTATYLAGGLKRLQSYFPMLDKLAARCADRYPGRVFVGDTAAFDYFKGNTALFNPESGQAGTFYLHPNKEGADDLGRFWADAILRILPKKIRK